MLATVYHAHGAGAQAGGQARIADGGAQEGIGRHQPTIPRPPAARKAAGPGARLLAMTIVAMPQLATAHLPGITGAVRDRSGEEVLARQPGGAGPFWWVQVRKDGLSTAQARAAVARAAQIGEELVTDAGGRDRDGCFVQWFSLPAEPVENPGALRNAGYRSSLRVLQVARAARPLDATAVASIRWSLVIAGGNRDGGYPRARAVLDHLRRAGLPNYVGVARLGRGGALARYGLLLLRGQKLPGGADASPGACLRAAQDRLFNDWLGRRVTDDLLAACLAGERLRTRGGEELLAEDPEHGRRRLESWECVQLGPLFGTGMAPVAGAAAEREAAILAQAGLDQAAVERLHGGRRAARVQPGRLQVECSGDDVRLTCDLPVDTYLDVLLAELVRAPGLDRGEGERSSTHGDHP